jgi:hypothetical protein
MGYAYKTFLRVHNISTGNDLNYNLSFLGGTGGPVSTKVEYKPETIRRMTPTRTIIEYPLGFRCMVTLKFELTTMTDDATYIVPAINAALSTANTAWLSLDNAVTYRQVVLDNSIVRSPLGGAAFAGMTEELVFLCVALLPTIPAIGTGAW